MIDVSPYLSPSMGLLQSVLFAAPYDWTAHYHTSSFLGRSSFMRGEGWLAKTKGSQSVVSLRSGRPACPSASMAQSSQQKPLTTPVLQSLFFPSFFLSFPCFPLPPRSSVFLTPMDFFLQKKLTFFVPADVSNLIVI